MTARGQGDFSIGSKVWPGTAKVIEEMSELTKVLAKLMARGGRTDYWGGVDLLIDMQDEAADVHAALSFFIANNHLDREAILARSAEKVRKYEQWQRERSSDA